MSRREKRIEWWHPPRGSEPWLLAVLEYLEAEETERLLRKRAAIGAERFAQYQFDEGPHDRAHKLFAVLQATLSEIERARFRLWINEGWYPPMVRPHGDEELQVPF